MKAIPSHAGISPAPHLSGAGAAGEPALGEVRLLESCYWKHAGSAWATCAGMLRWYLHTARTRCAGLFVVVAATLYMARLLHCSCVACVSYIDFGCPCDCGSVAS